jgi:ankyrin repeat protein
LYVAAECGRAEAVLFLLDQGADALDSDRRTPFIRACIACKDTTAQILISRTADVILQAKVTLDTALHFYIRKRIDETAKLIIATTLDVDMTNIDGMTALINIYKERGISSTSKVRHPISPG